MSSSGSQRSVADTTLVELRREDLVAPFVLVGERLLRPPGLHAFVGFLTVRRLGGFFDLRFGGGVFAVLVVRVTHVGVRELGFGAGLHTFIALIGLRLGLTLVVGAFAFGVLGKIVAEFEVVQDRAREFGERLLVAKRRVEFGEVFSGAFFDPGTPEIDSSARAFRRGFARELLAHDEANRVGQRRFGAVARLGKAACVAALFELCGEIAGDALHGERADRFHARLFGGFEDGRRIGRLRPILLVHRVFVESASQRVGIALAAHDGDFVGREIARGQGQPCL